MYSRHGTHQHIKMPPRKIIFEWLVIKRGLKMHFQGFAFLSCDWYMCSSASHCLRFIATFAKVSVGILRDNETLKCEKHILAPIRKLWETMWVEALSGFYCSLGFKNRLNYLYAGYMQFIRIEISLQYLHNYLIYKRCLLRLFGLSVNRHTNEQQNQHQVKSIFGYKEQKQTLFSNYKS